jgi:hypothetical protein
MVRRLLPAFRQAYASLWKALLLRDSQLGLQATLALGLSAEHYDALSLMLTYRSAQDSSTALGARMQASDAKRIKAQYSDVSARDINLFMQTLPRDFLFVSRTSNLVRACNLSLGGTSRQRFRATGHAAIAGLALSSAVGAPAVQPPGSEPLGSAVIVADAPSTLFGSAGGGGGRALAGSSELESSAGLLSLLQQLLQSLALRKEQPVAPLTYLTARQRMGELQQSTESEGLAAGRGSQVLLPWWSRLACALESASLEARLWWVDVLLSAVLGSAAQEQQAAPAGSQPAPTSRMRREMG